MGTGVSDYDSIFSIVNRFRAEQREQGDTVERLTLNSLRPLEGLPTVPSRSEGASLFGIPVRTDENVPKGCGVLTTRCNHSYAEVEHDGGKIMHAAKRHTVIIKFDSEGNDDGSD